MDLYPLQFDPIFKEKLWGGSKIRDILGKDFSPLTNCGETWEMSGVKGNLSKVSSGHLAGKTLPELIDLYKGDLVGNTVYDTYGNEFPLLIKFIDAAQDLSVQVHPNDQLAKERHGSLGKTEMWYVFQADEGSTLITGFNREMTRESYLDYFHQGRLMEILNKEEVSPGDTFFIPAGRIHTIGKGLLLAEIQQTSDITYRIHDFDRTDAEGNKRELHTIEALDAIDYQFKPDYKTSYESQINSPVSLVKSPYFETNLLHCDKEIVRDHSDKDSFVIYICVEGEGEMIVSGSTTNFCMGNAILLPQTLKKVTLQTNFSFKMLETYAP